MARLFEHERLIAQSRTLLGELADAYQRHLDVTHGGYSGSSHDAGESHAP
jgi:hypothetical protein